MSEEDNDNNNDSSRRIIHTEPFATIGGDSGGSSGRIESAADRARRDASANRASGSTNSNIDGANSNEGDGGVRITTNDGPESISGNESAHILTSESAGAGSAGIRNNVVGIKRGRHPKPCDRGTEGGACDRCKEKESLSENANRINTNPKAVNPFDFVNDLAALNGEFAKGISMLWNLIYQIPVMMTWGEHWALNEKESKDLTAATQALLKSVPDKQRESIMEVLNKYVPFTTFAGTIAVTTYPRYLITKMAVQKSTGAKERRNVSPINQRNDGSGIAGQDNGAVRFIDDNS